MMSLRDRWKGFCCMLLDPIVILLLAFTVLLSWVLVSQQTAAVVEVVLTFLIAVFSGLLGGVLGKRWDDITGERVIVARAKSAVRSLKLQLGQITALERRTKRHLQELSERDDNQTAGILESCLEETIERCVLLEEGALSAIESWTDVTPEADIKSQIGVISELYAKVHEREQDIGKLTEELKDTRGKSEKAIQQLRSEKQQKEKELRELRQQLSARSIGYGAAVTGTGLQLGGSHLLDSVPMSITGRHVAESASLISSQRLCRICGNQLKITDTSDVCSACLLKGGK